MMEEVHFLIAILYDLASPTPHLIFADWLEEQGETARAEEERATGRAMELGRLAFNFSIETSWLILVADRHRITEDMLDNIVANFHKYSTGDNPTIRVSVNAADGSYPPIGFVRWLWKSRGNLIADMPLVPSHFKNRRFSVDVFTHSPRAPIITVPTLRRVIMMPALERIEFPPTQASAQITLPEIVSRLASHPSSLTPPT